MKLLFLTLTTAAALTGCLQKEDHSPSTNLTPKTSWSTSSVVSTDTNVTYWAKGFGDANLTSLVREAWGNSPDLSGTFQLVKMAREQAVMAGADLLPQAGLGMSGTRSKRNLVGFMPGNNISFTSENYGLNMNVSWELDLWGKLSDSRKVAASTWEATIEDYRAARLSLAGQVAKAWYSAIAGSRQLDLAHETEKSHIKNASYIAKRFERGLANALDHNLAQATLSTARANQVGLKRKLDLATRTLQTLIGRYPDGVLALPSDLPAPKKAPPIAPPAQTLEHRPDLRAKRLRMKATGLEKTIARKNLLPSLSLTGGPGSRSQEFNNLLDQQFRIWSVTGNLMQPIFQGGRLRANIRRAEAVRLASIDSYKATALQAFGEVEMALASESLLKEEEKHLSEAAKAALTAADLSWERYQRGLEGIFTTLESRRRAFEAKSRLLSLRRERLLNRIDLHLALGDEALPDHP
jgi:NodT family efflux transporter outer membrane factor (OMF) lipoprotein